MRMARIKYKLVKDAPSCELISAPTNFRIAVDALGGATVSLPNQDWYTLAMPLDEAIAELNAALMYPILALRAYEETTQGREEGE